VTVIDNNVGKKGTRAVATADLEYLYRDEAQDIIGRHFYRPTSSKAQAAHARDFPKLTLFGIDEAFGGWTPVAATHFSDGAIFDPICLKKPKVVGLALQDSLLAR